VAYAALNNLDTLRSYGSAGDELEHVPPDYLRNLNRERNNTIVSAVPSLPPVPPSNPASDTDSIHKHWIDSELHLPSAGNTYNEGNKIKNGKLFFISVFCLLHQLLAAKCVA
jgi:hypothetical protein